jgi:hypothetical protein
MFLSRGNCYGCRSGAPPPSNTDQLLRLHDDSKWRPGELG